MKVPINFKMKLWPLIPNQ